MADGLGEVWLRESSDQLHYLVHLAPRVTVLPQMIQVCPYVAQMQLFNDYPTFAGELVQSLLRNPVEESALEPDLKLTAVVHLGRSLWKQLGEQRSLRVVYLPV